MMLKGAILGDQSWDKVEDLPSFGFEILILILIVRLVIPSLVYSTTVMTVDGATCDCKPTALWFTFGRRKG